MGRNPAVLLLLRPISRTTVQVHICTGPLRVAFHQLRTRPAFAPLKVKSGISNLESGSQCSVRPVPSLSLGVRVAVRPLARAADMAPKRNLVREEIPHAIDPSKRRRQHKRRAAAFAAHALLPARGLPAIGFEPQIRLDPGAPARGATAAMVVIGHQGPLDGETATLRTRRACGLDIHIQMSGLTPHRASGMPTLER